jgi:hypothetical protein
VLPEVPVDLNRQIHHLMQSFPPTTPAALKISQHAAEIDSEEEPRRYELEATKQAYAE